MSLIDNDNINNVVEKAFHDVHQDYSIDNVVICDKLNKAFIEQCNLYITGKTVEEFNMKLLGLRKNRKPGNVYSFRLKIPVLSKRNYLRA